MPLNNPTQILLDAKRIVESERRTEIRLNSNGGNSILLVCDPMKEIEFIAKIKELFSSDKYSIIDLNNCLINFISNHKDEIDGLYNMLQSATHEIFKAPSNEESSDLFKLIIQLIENEFKVGKVPILTNTGSLYGTGIHNLHIMEHEVIMKSQLPLLILYPATIEPDQILFLGKQSASKYRCMIIQ